MNFAHAGRCLIVLIAGGLTAATVRADTVQLVASRDTTIFSDDATASNGAGPVLFAGRTNRGAGVLRRGLVAFDLSAIPAGSTITSASVRLAVTREPGTPPQLGSLRRVLAVWGEAGSANTTGNGAPAQPGDATWSHRVYGVNGQLWTTPGGDLAVTTSASTLFGAVNTTVTFASNSALVSDVQAWVDQAATNHGWALLGDETAVGSATQFASRENANAALRPQLEVVFAPPSVAVPASGPTTAVLAGVILLATGLLALRHRRLA